MVQIPVFVINGFVESGKTTLIKEIIEQNSDLQKINTVIIATEEGELEYDDEFCKRNFVKVIYVNKVEELTKNFFIKLDDKYTPSRVVIEWNSFFDQDVLNDIIPSTYVLAQNIALIDASTFGVYAMNMRQIFNNICKYADLIVFNRIEGIDTLSQFRRMVRGLNQDAQIAFAYANGQMTDMLDEDLPYDISKDKITLDEDHYPIWYYDCIEHPEKYEGKEFTFMAKVYKLENDNFVPGRMVMTCCEDDIQFLGLECINETKVDVNTGEWVYITCKVSIEYSELAESDAVMLRATSITKLKPQEDRILSL